jgi:hypothetical protein
MANAPQPSLKLVRCTMCDLLIPVKHQLGLHPTLYCSYEPHWKARGYTKEQLLLVMREHLERKQQEAAAFAQLDQVYDQMRDFARQIAEMADRSASPELDAQVRELLAFLDKPPTRLVDGH